MTEHSATGRILAIGDIHGCDVALRVLLEKMAPQAGDTVVILGDAIDRGPGTRQVIEQLLKLQSICRLVFIRGNHEEMMLAALEGRGVQAWLEFGGLATMESYGGRVGNIPREHIAFLKSTVPSWETETEIYVHANLEPDVPLPEQSALWLRWMRLKGTEAPHPSGKRVICGHTPQLTGLPGVFSGWVCLDTYAYGEGYLTCLDVGTGKFYQSQQSGAFYGERALDALR